MPIALIMRPRAPITIPFWDSVSTHMTARTAIGRLALLDLLDLDLDRVRDLLAGPREDLLAHELGEHDVLGLVGDVLGWEVERPLGQQPGEEVDQRRHAPPVRAEIGNTSASGTSSPAMCSAGPCACG